MVYAVNKAPLDGSSSILLGAAEQTKQSVLGELIDAIVALIQSLFGTSEASIQTPSTLRERPVSIPPVPMGDTTALGRTLTAAKGALQKPGSVVREQLSEDFWEFRPVFMSQVRGQ